MSVKSLAKRINFVTWADLISRQHGTFRFYFVGTAGGAALSQIKGKPNPENGGSKIP